MKIFKFGGASTKDAQNIQNVLAVVEQTGERELVIVISAMGKMTNALEKVVEAYWETNNFQQPLSDVRDYHFNVLQQLFPNSSHPIFNQVDQNIKGITHFLNENTSQDRAFVYDQVVGYGEIMASLIISAYFSDNGLKHSWLDVRQCIKTDDNYRDATVQWQETERLISEKVKHNEITITQGFLGSDFNNFTTTLGREGSDYSAAIFAYCLNAECVTIWKDVPGVLNADPRYFAHPQLLRRISYREAIELAFYGASVIHPKTLQPLQRREIPLYVKSFLAPLEPGTCVGEGVMLEPAVSCFILKKNLTLISLSSLDFSFIMEDHISDVFRWLHQYRMKVELIQNSAISFSVCVNDKFGNLHALLQKLREKFSVKWNENVTLYTVRHFDPLEIKALRENKQVLLKQETQETVQLVIKE